MEVIRASKASIAGKMTAVKGRAGSSNVEEPGFSRAAVWCQEHFKSESGCHCCPTVIQLHARSTQTFTHSTSRN